MKTEKEVKEMLKKLIEQYKTVDEKSKDFNPTAARNLSLKITSLAWVLGLKGENKSIQLLLTKDQIDLYACLY